MKTAARKRQVVDQEPVRVLGRGLGAQRGVHLPLRAVREGAGKTQVDVAAAAKMDQSDVSRLERRADFDDCQVATLRRYIEAIGGQMEITAVFGQKRITISAGS